MIEKKGERAGLVTLAYIRSSRGLEVASKSPVLCSVSQLSFRVGRLKKAVLRVTRQGVREAYITF